MRTWLKLLQKHKTTIFVSAIVTALALCASGIGIVERHIVAKAFLLATTHRAESYTELYFENSSQLPTSTPAGRKQTFTFHLINHEGYTTTYHYITTMNTGQQIIPIADETVTLEYGEGIARTETFTVPSPKLQPILNVTLAGRHEFIQFRTQS